MKLKSKTKFVSCIFLTVILMLSILTSCGGNDRNGDSGTIAPEKEGQNEADSGNLNSEENNEG